MTVQTFATRITKKQTAEIVDEIRRIVRNGQYMDVAVWPGYQTADISHQKVFGPLVRSFHEACEHHGYRGPFVQLWAYVDRHSRQEQFGHDRQWHNHQQAGILVSGVMYLVNPENVGTEFTDETVTEGRCGVWNLFQPQAVHRPGKLSTNEWRYSIAANLREWRE